VQRKPNRSQAARSAGESAIRGGAWDNSWGAGAEGGEWVDGEHLSGMCEIRRGYGAVLSTSSCVGSQDMVCMVSSADVSG
jgi:hypothetical protein